MSDPNIGQVAASTWDKVIGPKPNDAIFNSRALFYALGEKGFKEEVAGGRYFECPVEYAENGSMNSIGELDTLDTTRYDVFDAAQYSPKIVAGTVVFSELERLRAQDGKFDLVAEKMENGRDSLIAEINRQAWTDGTGNGGKDIGGLALIIAAAPTTGTVGGIDRSLFTWWRNKQTTATASSTAFDTLRAAMRTIYNSCSLGGVNMEPTAAITTATVFAGYESLLVAYERYAKDGSGQRGGNAGFANNALKFKGADIFYDEDCPASTMRFLNPKALKLAYYKGGWMKFYPEVTPANQLAAVNKVATFCNLVSGNPRHLGVITAIS